MKIKMPLVVIPVRKGMTGSWVAEKEWKKENKIIPKGLQPQVIDNLLQVLAMTQMNLDGRDYGNAYFPFYQQAVRTEAFDKVENELSKLLRGSKEWKWMRETYDTNDTYLKFTRIR